LADMKFRMNVKYVKDKGWDPKQLNILPRLRGRKWMLCTLLHCAVEFCKYVDIIGSLSDHWFLKHKFKSWSLLIAVCEIPSPYPYYLQSFKLILYLLTNTDDAAWRQHRWCFIPQAVNTVWCTWGWTKLSPETCWANWNF